MGASGVAARRRDAGDDRLQHLFHPDPGLGRDVERVPGVGAEQVGDLLRDPLRLGAGQVDLVDHRDQLQPVLDREVGVGDGLRLDPLGGVHDQQRALAGGEAAADLVGEVDVAGGVDQVQVVGLAVAGGVLDPHRLRLDRDPALALEVHRVEQLGLHFLRVDGAGQLEDAIGQGRLAVVDVGDDREVADLLLHGRAVSMARVGGARLWLSRRSSTGSSWPVEDREDDGRRLAQDRFGAGRFEPFGGCGIGRLARFDPVAAGDDVVVVAGVDEAQELAAAARLLESPVRARFADVLDAVGEVGAEQRVLPGAGRPDPRILDFREPRRTPRSTPAP